MKKKVAIVCPYSYPSACGVWKRAFEDAKAVKEKGGNVTIFSSNIVKGTSRIAPAEEVIQNIRIYRFRVFLSLGGTSMFWFPFKKLREFDPDIIHVHGFRHPHSLMGLIWGKIRRKKVILTTHAPFKKDPRRSLVLKMIDFIYDIVIARWELRTYDQLIRVSQWESKYLKKLSGKSGVYIPNGITDALLQEDVKLPLEPFNKIIFMGRIDPVKRVEWILDVAKYFKDKKFVIIGPVQGYKLKNGFLGNFEIPGNVEIQNRKYVLNDFIHNVKSSDIFVLPSIREAQSMALLEAMALSRIVVASNSLGPLDYIKDGINGFIVKDIKELKQKIEFIYTNWVSMKIISKNAYQTSLNFAQEKMNKKLVELYSSM
jgi:glycosyltransferase involved in cell wall biosynthesis